MKEQLNLGQLIFLLARCDPTAIVRFDFVYFVPTTIDSYRGYYEQLAIGYTNESGVECTVEDLLKRCKDMLGAKVTGYKGGEYFVGETTPMWVANTSEAGGTAIIGVNDNSYVAILETQYIS